MPFINFYEFSSQNDPADASTFNVESFAAVGDGVTNNDAAIAAALAAAYARGGGRIYFPRGVWAYDTTLHVTQGNVVLCGDPGAILLYRGGGATECVFFDGGAAGQGIVNCGMEGLQVDGNGTADVGVRVRACHHSIFANVRARNVVQVGFLSNFGVSNVWANARVTSNEPNAGVMPATAGLQLDMRGAGEKSNANMLINCIMEGLPNVGFYLNAADMVQLYGGVSESNAYGLYATENGELHTIIGLWGESNATADIFTNTNRSDFINVKANTSIHLGALAYANTFHRGCVYGPAGVVVVDAGAKGNVFDRMAISAAAKLTDGGTGTVYTMWDLTAVAYFTGGPYANAT